MSKMSSLMIVPVESGGQPSVPPNAPAMDDTLPAAPPDAANSPTTAAIIPNEQSAEPGDACDAAAGGCYAPDQGFVPTASQASRKSFTGSAKRSANTSWARARKDSQAAGPTICRTNRPEDQVPRPST